MRTTVLRIEHDAEGIFKDRPNRFLGMVQFTNNSNNNSTFESAHIHDPGRLKELLFAGNKVLLKHATNQNRKTRWDVIAALNGKQWVFIHSGFHRAITENILRNKKINPFGKLTIIRPEIKIGHSRLDFQLITEDETKILVEVKGCTLTQEGIALFPDAPTTRGVRHIQTLLDAQALGYSNALLILIFRKDSKCFAPNKATDPHFASIFKLALKNNIKVYPIVLSYDGSKIFYEGIIPVCNEK